MPSPVLIHFHFHNRRTGVTRSIESVTLSLQKKFSFYIFGYGIAGPKIGLRSLLKLVMSRNYFVLHVHRNNEMLFALLLRMIGGKFKLVATRHAESKPSSFTLFLLKRADEVIALTPSMAQQLPMKSTVIGHGVNTTVFIPTPSRGLEGITQKNIISVIGRVRKAKGQHIFMEAIAPILKRNPEWAALIIGRVDKPAFLEELKQIVKANNVENQVYFFDETSEIIPMYQGSTAVVVPSFTEGFSLVCLEAMACGSMVVATENVGIHSELIRHGETGYLFPAGDAQKLRSILEEIIASQSNQMAEEIRNTAVTSWDIEVESSKLTQLYLE
jgi:mannosyltransferase